MSVQLRISLSKNKPQSVIYEGIKQHLESSVNRVIKTLPKKTIFIQKKIENFDQIFANSAKNLLDDSISELNLMSNAYKSNKL